MTAYTFTGSTSPLPYYGMHYSIPVPYQSTGLPLPSDIGNGFSASDAGSFSNPQNWDSGSPTNYNPGQGIFSPTAPGPGDDVTIEGFPDGSWQSSQGPVTPVFDYVVSGGDFLHPTYEQVGSVSGYTGPSPISALGLTSSGGFNVQAGGANIGSLTVGGPGTFNNSGAFLVSGNASFDAIGGMPVVSFPSSGVVANGYAPAAQTITGGGTLTAGSLVLVATTDLTPWAIDPGAISPTADAGSLAINGAFVSAGTVQVLGQPSLSATTTDSYATGTVSVTGGATLKSTGELDIVGNDPSKVAGITGTPTLVVNGGSLAARQLIVATAIGGFESGTTSPASLTLSNKASLNATGGKGTGGFTIGDTGNGTFSATTGSTITAVDATLANMPSITATATLDASTWTNTGSLTIGSGGVGTLTVLNGATLMDQGASLSASVGFLASSAGSSVVVSGTGSTWQSDGDVSVGIVAAAQLTVSNGASFAANDGLYLGFLSGATGHMDLFSGSTATTDSTAGPTTSSTVLGFQAGATAYLDIDGANTSFDSKAAMSVGYGGTGNLSVSGSANVTIDSTIMRVGRDPGSVGHVLVSGDRSQISGNLVTLYAGYGGAGDVQINTGGTLDVQGTNLGGQATGSGTVTLNGQNTTGNLGTVTIGAVGTGALVIGAAAVGNTKGTLIVGSEDGSNGTITLTDQDTSFTTGGSGVALGAAGNAVVSVGPGATFDASLDQVVMGQESSGRAAMTLTGLLGQGIAGEFDAARLTVGESGQASIDAETGSSVGVVGGMTVGESIAAQGTVIIDGKDSGLTVGGSLTLGGAGNGTLTIGGAGASASVSGDTTVGEAGRGSLSMQGGEFDATGKLILGASGVGFAYVQLGGSLSASAEIVIGEGQGGNGDLVVVGGNVSAGGDITDGKAGSGDFSITQGGSVQVIGNVDVAGTANAIEQTLTIDSGGVLDALGTIAVGESGLASARVLGGGQLIAASGAAIGDNVGAVGALMVDGVGSTFTFGTLTVGGDGTGSLTIQNGALAGGPSSGGTVAVTTTIGMNATGSGTLVVTGPGSVFRSDVLTVGGAPGGSGTLDIEAGGSVHAATVAISTSGALTLAGGTLTTDPLSLAAGSINIVSGQIDGAISGPGALTIGAGGTLTLTESVAAGTTVDFAGGAPRTLVLSDPGEFQGVISGFVAGDTIDIGAFQSNTAVFGANAITVIAAGGGTLAAIQFDVVPASGVVATDSANRLDIVACYAAGTKIATTDGPVPIEHLRTGHLVTTASGDQLPVRWIGHRHVDCARHPDPRAVWPVRVSAGAFGTGLPDRDLFLSPDHAVFVDGVLVPVKCLIDGTAVQQIKVDQITYFHLELDQHDILLAEGLPAESYLENGGRDAFDNGSLVARWPDFGARRLDAVSCAERVTTGPRLLAIRERVRTRRAESPAQPGARRAA